MYLKFCVKYTIIYMLNICDTRCRYGSARYSCTVSRRIA